VSEYNREKDPVTIEKTFEALLKLVKELGAEESRAIREGLDEETLAIFDLLKKSDLKPAEIKGIKKIAVELLASSKEEELKVDHWCDKEATRDAVRLAIRDFLWDDLTGLPVDAFAELDVEARPRTCSVTCIGRIRPSRRHTSARPYSPCWRAAWFAGSQNVWIGKRKAK
jgi:type I restriction enzyme, R subunit